MRTNVIRNLPEPNHFRKIILYIVVIFINWIQSWEILERFNFWQNWIRGPTNRQNHAVIDAYFGGWAMCLKRAVTTWSLFMRDGSSFKRVFHELSTIQECQYCQLHFICTIINELHQRNLYLQHWDILILYLLIFRSHVLTSCDANKERNCNSGADPGGGPGGPGSPLDPRFWGPKIEHFWALFNFSIIFFCLASLGILFL